MSPLISATEPIVHPDWCGDFMWCEVRPNDRAGVLVGDHYEGVTMMPTQRGDEIVVQLVIEHGDNHPRIALRDRDAQVFTDDPTWHGAAVLEVEEAEHLARLLTEAVARLRRIQARP